MVFWARLMLLVWLGLVAYGCSGQMGSINALGYNVKYRYPGFQHDRYEVVVMPQGPYETYPDRDQ